MRLNEWQYINPPAKNAGPTSASSTGYKKRFEKLIKYHIDHASSELESITTKDISNWHFRLGEHYNTGSAEFDRDIAVSVDKATNIFYLNIFVDGKQVYHNDYESYEEVLEILTDTYMFLPDDGTQEYDDLLVEWVAMKNNSNTSSQPASSSSSTSKTNKEKFTELLQYIVDHKLASVLTVDISRVDENGFTYRELRQPVGLEPKYELATIVNYGYGQNNSSWQVSVYKNGKNIDVLTGEGWEELLGALDIRYNVPDPGSPEHKSICEWVVMNKKQVSNSPASASNTSSNTFYKDKFKKLLDYHMAHSTALSMSIDKLSEDDAKASFSYVEEYEDVKGKISESLVGVRYYKDTEAWSIKTYINGIRVVDKEGIVFNELIKTLRSYMKLPPENSTEHKSICESASFADDFRLYENLWD